MKCNCDSKILTAHKFAMAQHNYILLDVLNMPGQYFFLLNKSIIEFKNKRVNN